MPHKKYIQGMSEEHKPKHTGPTNQAQIPTYKGCGDCDRWRLPATSQSQKKGRVVVYVAVGHNWWGGLKKKKKRGIGVFVVATNVH